MQNETNSATLDLSDIANIIPKLGSGDSPRVGKNFPVKIYSC